MGLLMIEGLKRYYREGDSEVRALDGIDLEVEKGEIIALLGPSGSGKTTLLNCIAALDKPTAGSYLFSGEDVPRTDSEAMTTFRRENIGYVFQFFNLLADLTAIENILLVQQISGIGDKQKAFSLLASVGLEGLEDRFPSEMSGGQQQRVAIARSLAKSPNLLLGDELTGNLDSDTTRQVMKVLTRSARKEGITTIFVTHDTSLTKYATRVVHLDSGRVVSDLQSERSRVSASLKSAVSDAAETVKENLSKAGGVISSVLDKMKEKVSEKE